MTEFGYALSSEEHGPADLVRNARMAEETGFAFALISDHFHPWTDAQSESPFVWAVIGGIAQRTERLRLGTGVTCPTIRIHPAVVAHAAATAGASEEEGAKTACEIWPNAALGGDLGYELPLPRHFEQATEDVTPETIAEAIPCGPDADRWLEDIRSYEQAGYTHLYFHQIGYDQDGFMRFWSEELEPKL